MNTMLISIIVAILGIHLSMHNAISNSIVCQIAKTKDEATLYEGKYMNLYHPSDWIKDEHPKSMVDDVYIGQENYTFGMWLMQNGIISGTVLWKCF